MTPWGLDVGGDRAAGCDREWCCLAHGGRPSQIGTPLSMQNLTRRVLVPILEAAGLPRMRPYDLRHSALSILASKGVDPKVIAARAGHSSIGTTYKHYVHLRPNAQDRAVSTMTAFAETGRRQLEEAARSGPAVEVAPQIALVRDDARSETSTASSQRGASAA